MKIIQDLLKEIQSNGIHREDRTQTGIQSIFGYQMIFDLELGESFPAISLRKFPLKTITYELLWFLKGTGSCDYLDENNVKIWKQWTEEETNSVGNMYGVQLRKRPVYIEVPNKEDSIQYHLNRGYILTDAILPHLKDKNVVLMYKEVDVLGDIIEQLKRIPNSRRHVVIVDKYVEPLTCSLWNPDYLPDETISPKDNVKLGKQALANCHGTEIQFNVNPLTLKQLKKYLNNYCSQIIFAEQNEFQTNPEKLAFISELQNIQQNVIDKFESNVENINMIPLEELEQIEKLNEKYKHLLDKPIATKTLSLKMMQRSADIPTAVGFNIGQYAMLLCMVAHITNMLPDKYVHDLGDAHIYNNQWEVVEEMLSRESLTDIHKPKLNVNKNNRKILSIDDFQVDDFELINYYAYDSYKVVPVAY